ncbi:MAG: carbohydrate ABC transporter permease [Alphaproteobacteria bacterium]
MSRADPRRFGPLAKAGIVAGIAVFVLWSMAPILWMVLSGFLTKRALIAQPPDLSPSEFTWQNFVEVFESAASLGAGMLNSLAVATLSTALALALGAPAAYALARLSLPRANVIAFMVLATQMLPAIAIAIPLFIVISRVGLIDSVLSLGVVYLSFNLPIVIWILRGFFAGIPAGLERAAAVDGAGPLRTFVHIILPISAPPLAAAALFAFIEAWNEFFFALVLTRQDAQTVPLVISQFAGQYQTAFGQMMAAALLGIAPIILLAVVFKDRIVRGFTDGLIKG